jgi:SAM-dependent methyltransferase
MINIGEIQGMKFPDVDVVRMFYKQGLDKKKGRVLELGCASGNNLSLFKSYGWSICGVDLDRDSIRCLYDNIDVDENDVILCQDISNDLVGVDGEFDVILVANVAYYLKKHSLLKLLGQ